MQTMCVCWRATRGRWKWSLKAKVGAGRSIERSDKRVQTRHCLLCGGRAACRRPPFFAFQPPAVANTLQDRERVIRAIQTGAVEKKEHREGEAGYTGSEEEEGQEAPAPPVRASAGAGRS